MDMPDVTVVGLCGSLRRGSFTHKVMEEVLDGAADAGASTRLLDLRDYELVFYGMVDESDYPEDVFRLRREVRDAQGIILGTPEYHGGLSGVLKNALDLMGFKEFEGKMLGLVGVAGGKMGAVNSLNALRHIGRSLHAWVLPQQVSVPQIHKRFDDRGNLVDQDIRERCLEIGRMVAQFSALHEMSRDQSFIKLWEGLAINPGGDK